MNRKSLGLILAGAVGLFPSSGRAGEGRSAPTGPFADEIKKFDQQGPTNDNILLVGSSSMRLWETFAEDLGRDDLVNRGFGGARIEDINENFEHVVTPSRQDVFYAGDNNMAEGETAEQILERFKTFAGMKKLHLPKTPVLVLSIKPSPARWQFEEVRRKANAMIEAFVEDQKLFKFLDVGSVLLLDGKPNEKLYREDQTHLNHDGYRLWAKRIRPRLLKPLPRPGLVGVAASEPPKPR